MLGQAGSGKLRVSAGQSKLAAKVAKKYVSLLFSFPRKGLACSTIAFLTHSMFFLHLSVSYCSTIFQVQGEELWKQWGYIRLDFKFGLYSCASKFSFVVLLLIGVSFLSSSYHTQVSLR